MSGRGWFAGDVHVLDMIAEVPLVPLTVVLPDLCRADGLGMTVPPSLEP